MQIYKISWGIYSNAGIMAMTSSSLTPCILQKEKRFLKKEDADSFHNKIKEAAALLGFSGSSFMIEVKVEDVE